MPISWKRLTDFMRTKEFREHARAVEAKYEYPSGKPITFADIRDLVLPGLKAISKDREDSSKS